MEREGSHSKQHKDKEHKESKDHKENKKDSKDQKIVITKHSPIKWLGESGIDLPHSGKSHNAHAQSDKNPKRASPVGEEPNRTRSSGTKVAGPSLTRMIKESSPKGDNSKGRNKTSMTRLDPVKPQGSGYVLLPPGRMTTTGSGVNTVSNAPVTNQDPAKQQSPPQSDSQAQSQVQIFIDRLIVVQGGASFPTDPSSHNSPDSKVANSNADASSNTSNLRTPSKMKTSASSASPGASSSASEIPRSGWKTDVPKTNSPTGKKEQASRSKKSSNAKSSK